MPLDREQIATLAHLSRLAVDDQTAASLGTDLERIMTMVQHVQDVDTRDMTETVHVHQGTQPLRPDQPVQGPTGLADSAARSADGFVVVPKTVD